MRFMNLAMLAVMASAPLSWGGEAPASGAKPRSGTVWIAIPGETGLMAVENPPAGLVERTPSSQPNEGLDVVSRSVNRELRDVARALRRLDQSYAIRGFQGCGAATAGSVFIDWRAKGLRKPDNVIILPPEPIVLGVPKFRICCEQCHREWAGTVPQCDCAGEHDDTTLPPSPSPEPLPPRD